MENFEIGSYLMSKIEEIVQPFNLGTASLYLDDNSSDPIIDIVVSFSKLNGVEPRLFCNRDDLTSMYNPTDLLDHLAEQFASIFKEYQSEHPDSNIILGEN